MDLVGRCMRWGVLRMSELLDGVVAAWDALPEDIAAEASLARLGLAIAAARAAAAAVAEGVPAEASWPGWVEPSMLWRHMDRAHGVPLLESEEADIRHAVSEEQERRIAALRHVLSLREGEIERWRASVCVLRAEMEHQALRASALEAVQAARGLLERSEANKKITHEH